MTETNGSTCIPSSQEEADTLIPYHALSISKHAEVVIASPYTDVFVLMVQMYPSLPCYLWFHTGNRNLNRNKPVQPVYNKLRHRLASAILSFHGQTGSDMSGRFAGRTNEVFMACDDDTLNEIVRPPNNFRWFFYSNYADEGRVFPNEWLTNSNNASSTRTLRSNDLVKGWEKPSAPSFSDKLWLGV